MATIAARSGGISGTASVTVNNAAPTVATPASATPSPVAGTTNNLSVLGADDGGESNLTYTWAATGTPPAPVSFSANGSNAAKNTTASFSQAGNYSLQVTITDAGGLSTTSTVNVTVNQTLTRIAVTPGTATLVENGTQQFTAVGYDQFGQVLASQPAFTWSQVSGVGSVSAAGLYTAPAAPGLATIAASSGGINGTASVTVNNAAPTVATPASATPSPVAGTTTNLSVLGADDGGESNLTYTWAATGTPPAPVSFSANDSNAAKNTTATFSQAGSYSLQVTITDSGGLFTTSTVNVTVNQTLTSIAVTPSKATLVENGTQQFSAVGYDQFGQVLASQPAFTWSQVSGIGSISVAGLYTAPAASGAATIAASSGGISGTAAVTVNHVNQRPTLTLPGPQNAGMSILVFSQAAGNPIIVRDVDAGTAPIEMTLTVGSGQITLASVQNLTQVTGNGTSAIVMHGSLSALNAAMNGMQFRPAAPSTTLKVTANDLGNTGIGGPKTASGAVAITASLLIPNNNNNNDNNNSGSKFRRRHGTANSPCQPGQSCRQRHHEEQQHAVQGGAEFERPLGRFAPIRSRVADGRPARRDERAAERVSCDVPGSQRNGTCPARATTVPRRSEQRQHGRGKQCQTSLRKRPAIPLDST